MPLVEYDAKVWSAFSTPQEIADDAVGRLLGCYDHGVVVQAAPCRSDATLCFDGEPSQGIYALALVNVKHHRVSVPGWVSGQEVRQKRGAVQDLHPLRNLRQYVYADGGVVGKNPSPIAGTWAYVHTNYADEEIGKACGKTWAERWPRGAVSNNDTEMLAVVRGLMALPWGSTVTVRTDSEVTIKRLRRYLSDGTFPPDLAPALCTAVQAVFSIRKIKVKRFELLEGHPSEEDFLDERGQPRVRPLGKKRGYPISQWNVLCDTLCNEAKGLARDA